MEGLERRRIRLSETEEVGANGGGVGVGRGGDERKNGKSLYRSGYIGTGGRKDGPKDGRRSERGG